MSSHDKMFSSRGSFSVIKHKELKDICNIFYEFQKENSLNAKSSRPTHKISTIIEELKGFIKKLQPLMFQEEWNPPYPILIVGITMGVLDHYLCYPFSETSVYDNDDFKLIISFSSNLLWLLQSRKKCTSSDYDYLELFSLPSLQDYKKPHTLSKDIFSSIIFLSCSVFFESQLQNFYIIGGSLAMNLFLRSSDEQRCQLILSLLRLFKDDESAVYIIPDSEKNIKGATLLILTLLQSVAKSEMNEVEKLSLIFINSFFNKSFGSSVKENEKSLLKHLESFIEDILNVLSEPLFPLSWFLLEIIIKFLMKDEHAFHSTILYKKFSLKMIHSIYFEISKIEDSKCSLNDTLTDLMNEKFFGTNYPENAKNAAVRIVKKYLFSIPNGPWVATALQMITPSVHENETDTGKSKAKRKRRKLSVCEDKVVINLDDMNVKPSLHSVAQKIYISLTNEDLHFKTVTDTFLKKQMFNYLKVNVLNKVVGIRELAVNGLAKVVLQEPSLLSSSELLQRTKDTSVIIRKKAMMFIVEYAYQNPESCDYENILLVTLPRVCDENKCISNLAVKLFTVLVNLDFIVKNFSTIRPYFLLILKRDDSDLPDIKTMTEKLFGSLKTGNTDILTNILGILLCIAEQKPSYIVPFVGKLCDIISCSIDETVLGKSVKLIKCIISYLDEETALSIQEVVSKILINISYYSKNVIFEVVDALSKLAVLMKNWSRVMNLFRNCVANIEKYKNIVTSGGLPPKTLEYHKHSVLKFSLIVGFILQCDRCKIINKVDAKKFVDLVLQLSQMNEISQNFSLLVLGCVSVRFVEMISEEPLFVYFKQSLEKSSTNLLVVHVLLKILHEDVVRVNDKHSVDCKDLKVMEDAYSEKVSYIIQEFLPNLLELYPCNDSGLRHALSRLVLAVFEHGMMPIKLIPALIAITTEKEESIRAGAISALLKLNVVFLYMMSMQGLKLSYKLQVILQEQMICGYIKDTETQTFHASLEAFYIALSKSHRRAFLQSIISLFFSDGEDFKDINILIYMADNLVYFPLTFEDLKFVLDRLDVVIHVHGPTLLRYFRKEYSIKGKDDDDDDEDNDDDDDGDDDDDDNNDKSFNEELTNLLVEEKQGNDNIEIDNQSITYDFHSLHLKTVSCVLLLSVREFLFSSYRLKRLDETFDSKKSNAILKVKKSMVFNFKKMRDEFEKLKSSDKLAKKGYALIKRKLKV